MKKLRFALWVLVANAVLVITGISSSHALIMNITDGSYTSASGESRSITGYLDLPYLDPPEIVHLFAGPGANVFVDGFDPFYGRDYSIEYSEIWNGIIHLFQWDDSMVDSFDRHVVWDLGFIYYDGYDVWYPYEVMVEKIYGLEWSWSVFDTSWHLIESFEIVASVSAGVPEPATILLLGSGLIGLGAFRKKFKK